MKINRVWAMPNKWTFKIKQIYELVFWYVSPLGIGWIDPFAGKYSLAQLTNDINPEFHTRENLDGLEFLKTLESNQYMGCLFDPPYSEEQCLRKYNPSHGGTAGRAEYWAKCKDEIARVIRNEGVVISFAWDSTGMGKKRGFEIIEILLVCHGACHNDTIVTVERKTP